MKTAFKWIAIAVSGLIAIILVGLMALGTASEIGIIPASVVQTGDELPKKQYAALRDAKILNRNEVVKFYYSDVGFVVTEGGSILTDQRIIGYWTEEETLEIIAYPLETLDRMHMIEKGGGLDDAEYEVLQRGDDENSLLLFLSVLDDRHLDMVKALEAQIEKNNAAHAKGESKRMEE